jgi:cytochrome c-type biogenesis protein CcmE
MTPVKRKRIILIFILLACITTGIIIITNQFKDNIIFFYSPTELLTKKISPGQIIRVGGLVKKGSVKHQGQDLSFVITDYENEISIQYKGMLPNMFKESQGMVAKGKIVNNILIAQELLTKHDENYMPREVSNILKK